MSKIEIIHADTDARIEQAFTIRRDVFVAEQGVSEAVEIDGLDGAAGHLLALADGVAVGTLRFRLLDDGWTGRIERVAVLKAVRDRRVGRALMAAVLNHLCMIGVGEARLHAQIQVRGFYDRLGFVAYGQPFDEDGIPHIAMRLDLAHAAAADRRAVSEG
jgi:predicted GNAT family N-acyltransferase